MIDKFRKLSHCPKPIFEFVSVYQKWETYLDIGTFVAAKCVTSMGRDVSMMHPLVFGGLIAATGNALSIALTKKAFKTAEKDSLLFQIGAVILGLAISIIALPFIVKKFGIRSVIELSFDTALRTAWVNLALKTAVYCLYRMSFLGYKEIWTSCDESIAENLDVYRDGDGYNKKKIEKQVNRDSPYIDFTLNGKKTVTNEVYEFLIEKKYPKKKALEVMIHLHQGVTAHMTVELFTRFNKGDLKVSHEETPLHISLNTMDKDQFIILAQKRFRYLDNELEISKFEAFTKILIPKNGNTEDGKAFWRYTQFE